MLLYILLYCTGVELYSDLHYVLMFSYVVVLSWYVMSGYYWYVVVIVIVCVGMYGYIYMAFSMVALVYGMLLYGGVCLYMHK